MMIIKNMLRAKPTISKKYQEQRVLPVRRSTLYRRHSCVRKQLTRQWLWMELRDKPYATISRRIVDIDLGDIETEKHTNVKSHEEFEEKHPNVITQQKMEEFLVRQYIADEGVDGVEAEEYAADFKEDLYKPWDVLYGIFQDAQIRQVGLYVKYHWNDKKGSISGAHIFSVLVKKEQEIITGVTMMDTVLYPVSYDDSVSDWEFEYDYNRVEQLRFSLAMRLLFLVDGKNTLESIMMATQFVKSREIGRTVDIQEGEGEGFCQHWDTFFLYMTMVRGFHTIDVFNRLARMQPLERQKLIYNFTNEIAREAQLKAFLGETAASSLPIQSTIVAEPPKVVDFI